MRYVSLFILLCLGISGSGVAAQQNKTVVELYTSQGCSSCPPADALLTQLAGRDDVIALALHVDYWDYIGWRDIFGDPKFTARQHSYARAAGAATIYTPQMVVGGQDHVIGSKPMAVMDLLAQHRKVAPVVRLSATRAGQMVQVSAPAAIGNPGDMVVQLVRYLPDQTVSIERGENAGKSIKYSNIVRDWQTIARWDGTTSLSLTAQADGPESVVVIIQRDGHGPILAAVELP